MDPLERFIGWFFTNMGILGAVPHASPSHMIDGVTAVTLFRNAPFQVQMFIVPPNHIIPEHTHPNVDSFEVHVGGEINFSHQGKWVASQDEITASTPSGLSGMRGMQIRVRPNDPHGGTFGPNGGVFISVQHWLNGVEPTCVASDYVGAVMGPEHLARVTSGDPVLKQELTAADAASGEM